MHLPTSEIITDLLLDAMDLEASKDELKEIIDSDPYARSIIEEERGIIEIEAYLSGELKKKAKERFEQKLSTNSQLQGELKLHKEINGYLILENFRQQLQDIHNKLGFSSKEEPVVIDFKTDTEKEERSFTKWMVAASILFLAVFSFTMFNNGSRGVPIEKRLYAEYYEPFRLNETNRFIVNSSGLKEAQQKYMQKDYHNALVIFNNLPNNIQIQTEKDFFIGLSLMEMKSFKQAIEKFNDVIACDDPQFLPQAYWYLGLCYLQTCQTEKARVIFINIVTDGIDNSEKAEQILKKLN